MGQIENVPSPHLPILLDMMRTHISEGIQITVKEVRPFLFDVGVWVCVGWMLSGGTSKCTHLINTAVSNRYYNLSKREENQ